MFYKVAGLVKAENVFNEVLNTLLGEDALNNLDGYIEPFYNCREEGLTFKADNRRGKDITIWVCEARTSDNYMVCWSNKKLFLNGNIFDDEAYSTAKYFGTFEATVEYIRKLIAQHLEV